MSSMFPVPQVNGASRVFPLFDYVPDGCITHVIEDNAAEPVLRIGNVVIVDTTDRHPAQGELYLVQYNHGRPTVAEAVLGGGGGDGRPAWWLCTLRRMKTNADLEAMINAGRPLYFSDGPYDTSAAGSAYLQSKICGRIVGMKASTTPEMRRVGPKPISRAVGVADWVERFLAAGGHLQPDYRDPDRILIWQPEPQSDELIALYRQLDSDPKLLADVKAAVLQFAPAPALAA